MSTSLWNISSLSGSASPARRLSSVAAIRFFRRNGRASFAQSDSRSVFRTITGQRLDLKASADKAQLRPCRTELARYGEDETEPGTARKETNS